MSMISERTTGEAGAAAVDTLTRRPQEPGWYAPRVSAAVCDVRPAARGRRMQPLRTVPGQLTSNRGTPDTLKGPEFPQHAIETSPKAPVQLFSDLPIASLYKASCPACRLSLVEQAVYAIIAASGLVAAGAGLYWVGKLVGHRDVLGAGIAKLLQ